MANSNKVERIAATMTTQLRSPRPRLAEDLDDGEETELDTTASLRDVSCEKSMPRIGNGAPKSLSATLLNHQLL